MGGQISLHFVKKKKMCNCSLLSNTNNGSVSIEEEAVS